MLAPPTTKETFGQRAPTLSRWIACTGRAFGRAGAWVFKEENYIRAGLVFFGCVVAAHLSAGMLVCPWPDLAVKTPSPNPWGGAPLLKWRHILSSREALLID